MVYVGGVFSSIGGKLRQRIAAFAATSGNVFSFDPNAANFFAVNAVVASSSAVFLGGGFPTIGGRPRQGYAQFGTP